MGFSFRNTERDMYSLAPISDIGRYIYLFWSICFCKVSDYFKEWTTISPCSFVLFKDLISYLFSRMFPDESASYFNNFYSNYERFIFSFYWVSSNFCFYFYIYGWKWDIMSESNFPWSPERVTEKFIIDNKSAWWWGISIELFLVVKMNLKVSLTSTVFSPICIKFLGPCLI